MKYYKYIYENIPNTIFTLVRKYFPLKIIDDIPNDIIEYLNLDNLEFFNLYRNYKSNMGYNKEKYDYQTWLLENKYYFFDLYRWHYREKISFIFDFYRQIVKLGWRNLQILDFGSGTGTRSLILARNNYLTLVEINEKLLDFSKWRFKKYDKKAEFSDKIPLDRKYDLILLIDVIGHLTEPIKCIDDICSVLKKNGLLYITFDNFNYTSQNSIHRNKEINFKELLKKKGLVKIKPYFYKYLRF